MKQNWTTYYGTLIETNTYGHYCVGCSCRIAWRKVDGDPLCRKCYDKKLSSIREEKENK